MKEELAEHKRLLLMLCGQQRGRDRTQWPEDSPPIREEEGSRGDGTRAADAGEDGDDFMRTDDARD